MATSFSTIIREVAKHANAFASGNAGTTQANYLTTPLTVAQVVDPYFNLSFIKDKVIDAHGRLALEIANVRAHPWRAYIGNSQTASLISNDVLPLVAVNNKTIVGAWGNVLNGNTPMTEAAPERVNDTIRFETKPLYVLPDLYYIDGNRIYHGVTIGVIINCCTYERADVAALVAADGNITLPDVLADAIVAGAVAELVVEAKGVEQAGYFKNLFEAAIASIRQGQTTLPMRLLAATA